MVYAYVFNDDFHFLDDDERRIIGNVSLRNDFDVGLVVCSMYPSLDCICMVHWSNVDDFRMVGSSNNLVVQANIAWSYVTIHALH